MGAFEATGVIAGVLLGIAFLSAGILKLRDGADWTKQAADMGVGSSISRVVPWVELMVGAATASQAFRPWPAAASLSLLLAFTVLLVVRIRDGSRPPCACFGSRSKRPLGTYHLIRNAVLASLAVLAIVGA